MNVTARLMLYKICGTTSSLVLRLSVATSVAVDALRITPVHGLGESKRRKEENATYGKMFTGHERDGKMLLKMSTDCRVTEEEADDGILMREKLLGATTQVQSCTQKTEGILSQASGIIPCQKSSA
ncbi:hypothetical protein ACLOJK_026696 [Asimina triloba]